MKINKYKIAFIFQLLATRLIQIISASIRRKDGHAGWMEEDKTKDGRKTRQGGSHSKSMS